MPRPSKAAIGRLEKVLARAPREEQRLFLMRLPQLLDIDPSDFASMKLAETSFAFWENSEDAVYDKI